MEKVLLIEKSSNDTMKNKLLTYVISFLLIALGLYGIYGYFNTMNNGNLSIYVSDASNATVSGVYITFSSIEVHGNQSGWLNYSTGQRTINIYGINVNNSVLLGNISLQPQKYTMIRIYITSVVVNMNGVNVTFNLSSKFAIINHPFNIQPHSQVSFIVEFKLNESLNVQSKIFTPYIGIVEKQ